MYGSESRKGHSANYSLATIHFKRPIARWRHCVARRSSLGWSLASLQAALSSKLKLLSTSPESWTVLKL